MLDAERSFNRPTTLELFDAEERISRGEIRAEDGVALIRAKEQAEAEVIRLEGELESERERAGGYASECEDLRERLEDYENGQTPKRRGSDANASALEAVEIWKARAEAAEAKLEKRANRKAGK